MLMGSDVRILLLTLASGVGVWERERRKSSHRRFGSTNIWFYAVGSFLGNAIRCLWQCDKHIRLDGATLHNLSKLDHSPENHSQIR